MQEEVVKIVIYVPENYADAVRKVLGDSGAGGVGNYSHCSFSMKGTGRFRPLENSHPTIGTIGELTEVAEERIETVCYRKDVEKIIGMVRKVHPYEEVAIDIYPLIVNPYETTRK